MAACRNPTTELSNTPRVITLLICNDEVSSGRQLHPRQWPLVHRLTPAEVAAVRVARMRPSNRLCTSTRRKSDEHPSWGRKEVRRFRRVWRGLGWREGQDGPVWVYVKDLRLIYQVCGMHAMYIHVL